MLYYLAFLISSKSKNSNLLIKKKKLAHNMVSILLSLSKRVFVGNRIPGRWFFVFQHFTDASPLFSDFLVLGKSGLSVAVPLKATPFFL